jgi:hypothetical protein
MLGVECLDEVVYVADPGNGLKVIDVSEPTSPSRITTVEGTRGAWNPRARGKRLFLACHQNGVRILDTANPRSPVLISSLSLSDGGEAYATAGGGSRLYIADLINGVEVVDVTKPTNPISKARAEKYGPHSVSEDGEYIFVADGRRGFVVLDYLE